MESVDRNMLEGGIRNWFTVFRVTRLILSVVEQYVFVFKPLGNLIWGLARRNIKAIARSVKDGNHLGTRGIEITEKL